MQKLIIFLTLLTATTVAADTDEVLTQWKVNQVKSEKAEAIKSGEEKLLEAKKQITIRKIAELELETAYLIAYAKNKQAQLEADRVSWERELFLLEMKIKAGELNQEYNEKSTAAKKKAEKSP